MMKYGKAERKAENDFCQRAPECSMRFFRCFGRYLLKLDSVLENDFDRIGFVRHLQTVVTDVSHEYALFGPCPDGVPGKHRRKWYRAAVHLEADRENRVDWARCHLRQFGAQLHRPP